MLSRDGKWYLYYTATNVSNPGDASRYVFALENATADPMNVKWTDKGKMNMHYSGLDGSVFEHQGNRYFVYSAYVGSQSVLVIARMKNPWTLAGQMTRMYVGKGIKFHTDSVHLSTHSLQKRFELINIK
jgi:GH43 family beta-xylosidase